MTNKMQLLRQTANKNHESIILGKRIKYNPFRLLRAVARKKDVAELISVLPSTGNPDEDEWQSWLLIIKETYKDIGHSLPTSQTAGILQLFICGRDGTVAVLLKDKLR